MKRDISDDKGKYVEDLPATPENAVREGHMREMCGTTKKLVGKYSGAQRPVRDKKGKLSTGTSG